MDIDWPRTLATAGVTLAVLTAVCVADYLDTDGVTELPSGAWMYAVGVAGIVLGLLLANALPG